LTRYGTWREVNVYYLSIKGSVKLGVNFSVMFYSTNGNDFCSETGSSTASLLCGSTVGYPSDSLASCIYARQHICYSAYMLSPVGLSVCHTGGSVKNGWS